MFVISIELEVASTTLPVILYPSGVFEVLEYIIIVTVFLSYDRREIRYKTLDSPRKDK